MTEQQNHLSQLLDQREKLSEQMNGLQTQSTRTKELFLKTQGAIEYLEAVGVTLPELEVTEETVEEEVSEEPAPAAPARKRTKKA